MCPTLATPWSCSPQGSSVPGILQAWILEWAAISSSRGCPRPMYQTRVSCIAGEFFTYWATTPYTQVIRRRLLSLRSHEIAQLENLKLKKQTTLHRNSQNKLHCSLTWKQSLTQTFGAALSWGNVAKMLRTGENGTDFSHALCPASLKKKEGEKSTFRKVRAYILCLTKLSGTNLGLSWGWSQGDCSDPGNCPWVSCALPRGCHESYPWEDCLQSDGYTITSPHSPPPPPLSFFSSWNGSESHSVMSDSLQPHGL